MVQDPILSLHAIQSTHTMRVATYLGTTHIITLVDPGSMHNFISARLVRQLATSFSQEHKLKVMVVNWGSVFTQRLCREVHWEAQGLSFSTEFFILPVKGCDMVLGVHWLLSLRSIT
ncbi:Integrase, catalytic core [Gossypium australe]|uniref:Integrase, catalytic core n=1 Tax=Gossypium australe TaxID=47621 RepID=A0A5B6WCE8_9ROSI|nr:Integrase, catalytic core [Gossypium australe]